MARSCSCHDAVETGRIEVRVHQFGADETLRLGDQRIDLDICEQQYDGRGAGLYGIAEPLHPNVGNSEIDNLGRNSSCTGSMNA